MELAERGYCEQNCSGVGMALNFDQHLMLVRLNITDSPCFSMILYKMRTFRSQAASLCIFSLPTEQFDVQPLVFHDDARSWLVMWVVREQTIL